MLSRKKQTLLLIKGRSAIELFIKHKRATQDIDMLNDKSDITSIIEYLQDGQKIIHFKFLDLENFNAALDKENKKIFTIKAYPKTRSQIVGFEQLQGIELTFNINFDHCQLRQFVKDFKIVKKNLKVFPNATAMTFTREMLIAEKYQSLISKPEESTRTKDLIDLANLFDEHIQMDKVYVWLLIKWAHLREAKTAVEIKTIISNNYQKELYKIKANFNDAVQMYRINFTYEECFKIYDQISQYMLSKLTK